MEGVEARHPFQVNYSADGGAEVDAELLLRLVGECIDGALAQADPLSGLIAGVCGCSFVNNILGVDAGRPVTPITSYANAQCR